MGDITEDRLRRLERRVEALEAQAARLREALKAARAALLIAERNMKTDKERP